MNGRPLVKVFFFLINKRHDSKCRTRRKKVAATRFQTAMPSTLVVDKADKEITPQRSKVLFRFGT